MQAEGCTKSRFSENDIKLPDRRVRFPTLAARITLGFLLLTARIAVEFLLLAKSTKLLSVFNSFHVERNGLGSARMEQVRLYTTEYHFHESSLDALRQSSGAPRTVPGIYNSQIFSTFAHGLPLFALLRVSQNTT